MRQVQRGQDTEFCAKSTTIDEHSWR